MHHSHTSPIDIALFSKLLKQNGASVTKQRLRIFELLHADEPQSMQILLAKCKGDIDRASLYRIIELFEQIGIAVRINFGWKYKIELGDIFRPHHHHLICLGCQKIIATDEDRTIEDLVKKLSADHGFTATKHQIEIQGYCKDCSNNS